MNNSAGKASLGELGELVGMLVNISYIVNLSAENSALAAENSALAAERALVLNLVVAVATVALIAYHAHLLQAQAAPKPAADEPAADESVVALLEAAAKAAAAKAAAAKDAAAKAAAAGGEDTAAAESSAAAAYGRAAAANATADEQQRQRHAASAAARVTADKRAAAERASAASAEAAIATSVAAAAAAAAAEAAEAATAQAQAQAEAVQKIQGAWRSKLARRVLEVKREEKKAEKYILNLLLYDFQITLRELSLDEEDYKRAIGNFISRDLDDSLLYYLSCVSSANQDILRTGRNRTREEKKSQIEAVRPKARSLLSADYKETLSNRLPSLDMAKVIDYDSCCALTEIKDSPPSLPEYFDLVSKLKKGEAKRDIIQPEYINSLRSKMLARCYYALWRRCDDMHPVRLLNTLYLGYDCSARNGGEIFTMYLESVRHSLGIDRVPASGISKAVVQRILEESDVVMCVNALMSAKGAAIHKWWSGIKDMLCEDILRHFEVNLSAERVGGSGSKPASADTAPTTSAVEACVQKIDKGFFLGFLNGAKYKENNPQQAGFAAMFGSSSCNQSAEVKQMVTEILTKYFTDGTLHDQEGMLGYLAEHIKRDIINSIKESQKSQKSKTHQDQSFDKVQHERLQGFFLTYERYSLRKLKEEMGLVIKDGAFKLGTQCPSCMKDVSLDLLNSYVQKYAEVALQELSDNGVRITMGGSPA